MTLGLNGALNGFIPAQSDEWHTNISSAPVDAMSNTIMLTTANDLAYGQLHPDFGTQYGIPYNVVDTLQNATQTTPVPQQAVPMEVYPGDSDLTYYPVQPGLAVEGNSGAMPGRMETTGTC